MELEELEKREQPGSYSVHTAQKEKEEREKKKRRKRSELHSLKGKNRCDRAYVVLKIQLPGRHSVAAVLLFSQNCC